MSRKKAVITGMGALSALGQDVQQHINSLKDGTRGLTYIDRSYKDVGDFHYDGYAGVVDEIPKMASLDEKLKKSADRYAILGLAAVVEAVDQAGLTDSELQSASLVFGASSAGWETLDENYFRLFHEHRTLVHPLTIPKTMANASASVISIVLGIKGLCFTIGSACSSSAHAVGEAVEMIRAARCDVAIVGGSEAQVTYGPWLAWNSLRALSKDPCRPFSAERTGINLGEGAAALVLESEKHAKARGAQILGEIVGYGTSTDACDLTKPSAQDAEIAIRRACKDASDVLEVESLDGRVIVSAHGTGTKLNDPAEARAIVNALGSDLNYRVIATKSAHGHLLGAAGALELLLAMECGRRGFAPAIRNYLSESKECLLPLVVEENEELWPDAVISNSFAFGGLNVCLIGVPAHQAS